MPPRTYQPTRWPSKTLPSRPNSYPDDRYKTKLDHHPLKPDWRSDKTEPSDKPWKPHVRHPTESTGKFLPPRHRTRHHWTPPPQDDIPDKCDTTYDAISIIRREVFVFKGRVS